MNGLIALVVALAMQGAASREAGTTNRLSHTDTLTHYDAASRPGVHHASARGRIVSRDGKPVEGVRVLLFARLSRRGLGTSVPLAERTTDTRGAFDFEAINAGDSVGISIEPPPELMRRVVALDLVSGTRNELGRIILQPNTTISGIVTIDDQDASALDRGRISVCLTTLEKAGRLPVSGPRFGRSRLEQGSFVIDEIPAGRIPPPGAILQITRHVGRRPEIYWAPITISPGERRTFLRVRPLRETLEPGEYRSVGRLEIRRDTHDPPDRPALHVAGTVRGPGGTPLAGCFVRASTPYEIHPGWRSCTDDRGRFRLDANNLQDTSLDLFFMGTSLTIRDEGSRPVSSLSRLFQTPADYFPYSTTMEIDFAEARRLELRAAGMEDSQATFSWRADDRWVPIKGSAVWLPRGGHRARVRLRASAPGFVPVTDWMPAPQPADHEGHADGRPLEISLGAAAYEQRTLRVHDAGGPIAGAIVDIDLVEGLVDPDETPLLSTRTDEQGNLSLLVDRAATHALTVYAPGHAPARAWWRADGPGEVEVLARSLDAIVRLEGVQAGRRVRVKPAGTDHAVAVAYAEGTEPVRRAVPEGRYDITWLDREGKVLGGLTRAVPEGKTTVIILSRDERPRVRLRLPVGQDQGHWSVWVERKAPRGGASGAPVASSPGGRLGALEPAATVTRHGPGQWDLTFTGTGRFTILCTRRGLPFELAREIDLEAGRDRTLTLPPLSATLEGAYGTYTGTGLFHGVAGPRLWIQADRETKDSSGWDLIAHRPEHDHQGAASFTLTPLPAGRYQIFQHLTGDPETHRATYAYGGIPVTLKAGETTRIHDFAEPPTANLAVRVLEQDGRPAGDATLLVRDRMFEAWLRVKYGGSTLAFAADPIPPPPASRLQGGRAVLHDIREGRLELNVACDNGRYYSFSRDVRPGEELVLALD